MTERDLKIYIFSLVREHDLNSKQTVETLKVLSKDIYILRDAKKCIKKIQQERPDAIKLLKENVTASIRRNEDIERDKLLFITTFIVALVFSGMGELFAERPSAWIFIGIIIVVGVIWAISHIVKQKSIFLYKLVSFIENLDG